VTETSTITLTSTITRTPTLPPTLTITPTPPLASTQTATVTLTQTPTHNMVLVYPNPFIPEQAQGKTLKFDHLPPGAEVKIFTITGELVWKQIAGGSRLTWEGKNQAGDQVAAGVYLYIVALENSEQTRGKIFLVR
jgi:hypothetical protein